MVAAWAREPRVRFCDGRGAVSRPCARAPCFSTPAVATARFPTLALSPPPTLADVLAAEDAAASRADAVAARFVEAAAQRDAGAAADAVVDAAHAMRKASECKVEHNKVRIKCLGRLYVVKAAVNQDACESVLAQPRFEAHYHGMHPPERFRWPRPQALRRLP